MDLNARLFLGALVGLCIYFAFLVGGQINLASEAMTILESCANSQTSNCVNSQGYTRLVNRWDGNVKVYWVIGLLMTLACGYFMPKRKQQV
ncbi:hypothetical protein [Alteromonas sp. a30]|uniref:hypothetical protein n=1 Tax=Alteromonas sp. a30 TaxID=2730917 RepID=UPI00227DD83C|nr:hypothetical protein [Alteromonas sp. a30]MCY7297535.1 hypothetical protein [Alteromonas sp. a30]